MPGCGTGYLPSGPGCSGAGGIDGQLVDAGGELVLVLQDLVVGDDLAGVGGHAAHRGDQAGLGAALDLVVGLVLADGVDQVVPFQAGRDSARGSANAQITSAWTMLLALEDADLAGGTPALIEITAKPLVPWA